MRPVYLKASYGFSRFLDRPAQGIRSDPESTTRPLRFADQRVVAEPERLSHPREVGAGEPRPAFSSWVMKAPERASVPLISIINSESIRGRSEPRHQRLI